MSDVSERLDKFLEQADGIDPKEEKFVIDTHEKADWAVRKIVQLQKENEENDRFVDERIKKIEAWREQAKLENQSFIDHLVSLLQPYALSLIAGKRTKTTKMPSGNISFRSVNPGYLIGGEEVKGDNEILTAYIKENAKEFLKVKESTDWGEFKQTLTVTQTGQVISADGEVLGFISAVEYPDKITVKERK